MIRLYSSTVDVGLFANALGQERDAPLLERRSELVEIRSVAPEARRISRVALNFAHEVLDFGRDLPTGAADEGADFVRIEQPPARTSTLLYAIVASVIFDRLGVELVSPRDLSACRTVFFAKTRAGVATRRW